MYGRVSDSRMGAYHPPGAAGTLDHEPHSQTNYAIMGFVNIWRTDSQQCRVKGCVAVSADSASSGLCAGYCTVVGSGSVKTKLY